MIEQYMCWSLVVQARGLSPRHPRATWVAAESISSSREFFFRIPNALSIVPRNSNLTPHALGRTDVNAFSYRRVEHRGARRIIFEADKADPLRYRRQRCLRLDPTVYTGVLTKLRCSSFVSARAQWSAHSTQRTPTQKPRSSRQVASPGCRNHAACKLFPQCQTVNSPRLMTDVWGSRSWHIGRSARKYVAPYRGIWDFKETLTEPSEAVSRWLLWKSEEPRRGFYAVYQSCLATNFGFSVHWMLVVGVACHCPNLEFDREYGDEPAPCNLNPIVKWKNSYCWRREHHWN